MTLNEATLRQITAARPDRSTWLTANAGSGKTRVLTDRVARLLLDGVDPQNILCLTYTKAAAGEMQNRLFSTLGDWAMMPDAELRATLVEKGVDQIDDLARARRLFAGAIETPGGLKIQTIHSFCSGLLRRFPLEAQVNPQFTEADERTTALLRQEVLEEIALEDGPAAESFAALIRMQGGSEVERFCAAIMGRAAQLGQFRAQDLADFLGADVQRTTQDLLEAELSGLDDLFTTVADICAQGSPTDIKAAHRLKALATAPHPNMAMFTELCRLFLFGAGTKAPFAPKLTAFPTQKTRKAHADVMAALDPVMEAVADLRPRVLAQIAFDRSRCLYDFAQHFIPRVKTRMRDRGLLAFDDLIGRAADLLARPDVAAWVLWRLDGGIDHILVDEAQDTSPAQWAVIKLLSQELAAGQGARTDKARTLFVVGDRKQSIFSFQGADPREFNRMQTYFDDMLADSNAPLATLSLDHSFRSSPAILSLVDQVFSGPISDALEPQVRHAAFFEDLPGRVDVWAPVERIQDDQPPVDWKMPVDRTSPAAPALRLADQIAAQIRHMVDHETLPHKVNGVWARRQITEADILILVRKRKVLFYAILRACKSLGLNVAGADKLKLGGEMAIKDLLALLAFLALPEDDMALACALRSPLFGWDEAQIYDLAHGRDGYLWQALRARDDHAQTRAILEDLRRQVDYLRPYEILSRILVRHGGRARLLHRLGAEAEEGIDALLSQALVYEAGNVPSISDFLIWMQSEDIEVKRQLGNDTPALRVMTVHGSKGLESSIVFMPETNKPAAPRAPALLNHGGMVIWPPATALHSDQIAQLVAEAAEAERRESLRLLYVGMTRAERWLIVGAAGDVGEGQDSWYSLIADQMAHAPQLHSDQIGPFHRIETGEWNGPVVQAQTKSPPPPPELPSDSPVAARPVQTPLLSPSDLGGAKALPGDTPATAQELEHAMARGTLLHRLLEYLPSVPVDDQRTLATRIAPEANDLQTTALRLVNHPEIGPLLAQGRPEQPITAPCRAAPGRIWAGTVDLLIEQPGEILAVDFKSNRRVPDHPDQIPDGILRQMGAYAEILAQIWPDHTIKTAVLWTEHDLLMDVPAQITTPALARAMASLDQSQSRS